MFYFSFSCFVVIRIWYVIQLKCLWNFEEFCLRGNCLNIHFHAAWHPYNQHLLCFLCYVKGFQSNARDKLRKYIVSNLEYYDKVFQKIQLLRTYHSSALVSWHRVYVQNWQLDEWKIHSYNQRTWRRVYLVLVTYYSINIYFLLPLACLNDFPSPLNASNPVDLSLSFDASILGGLEFRIKVNVPMT